MIRTLITPDKQDVSIHIPENYVGKQIEVLLYAVDELDEQEPSKSPKTADFRGALKLTDEQYLNFQAHLGDIRNEWNRKV